MKYAITLLTLLCLTAAQAQEVYYYDEHWQPTREKDHAYKRVVEHTGAETYVVNEFYRNGTLYSTGRYITPEIKYLKDYQGSIYRQDTFKYYHPNGQLKKKGEYVDGIHNGLWLYYHDTGVPEKETISDNGRLIAGTLYYKDSSIRYTAGYEKDGYQQWMVYRKYNRLGDVVAVTKVDDYGNEESILVENLGANYHEKYTEAAPDYDLKGFIERRLMYPAKQRNSGQGGNILIGFTIDKQGYVTDVTPLWPHYSKVLQRETIKVIQKMPPWQPATKEGKPLEEFNHIFTHFDSRAHFIRQYINTVYYFK